MKDDHVVSECAVFVGVSLDGVIAQPNGDLDWLMGEAWRQHSVRLQRVHCRH